MAGLQLETTPKFTVLSLEDADRKDENQHIMGSPRALAAYSPQTEHVTEDDPNNVVQMMSGAFAMSMFTIPDNEDGQDNGPCCTKNDELDAADILREIAAGGRATKALADPSYWEWVGKKASTLVPLSTGSQLPRRIHGDETILTREEIEEELDDAGFVVLPPVVDEQNTGEDTPASPNEMAAAVKAVESLGWPPIFAFMLDAPWTAIQRAWGVAGAILGDDCEMEPSMFIWSLRNNEDIRCRPADSQDFQSSPPLSSIGTAYHSDAYGVDIGDGEEEKRCDRVGQQFSLPHRDFSYNEAHFPDGSARVLNVWIPLTDVTVDNGCLWVVPKEFDPMYTQSDHYDHSRPATPAFEKGVTKLRFPVAAARPLPCQAGSAIAWHNVIHWGGACGKRAKVPRIAVAATFKVQNAQATHLTSSCSELYDLLDPLRKDAQVTSEDGKNIPSSGAGASRVLPLISRARLVARALLIYEDWYDLNKSIPRKFFEMHKAYKS